MIMSHNILTITSESGTLKEIIIGNPSSFIEGEKINEAMRKNYGTTNSPVRSKLISEYEKLSVILQKNNVNVHTPLSLSLSLKRFPNNWHHATSAL